MSRTYLIRGQSPSYTESPFCIRRSESENQYRFSGGLVVSLGKDRARVSGDILKTDAGDGEFYLNIRSFPLSRNRRSINVLTSEEVDELKLESDDLLNIYIPIAKVDSDGQVIETSPFNSNFLYIKKGNEKRMSGYFDDHKVYLSGFVLQSPSNEIIQVVKNQEISAADNDIIYLEFIGKIKNLDSADGLASYNTFWFEDFGIKAESPDLAAISSDYYTVNDDTKTRSKREYDFSFCYPIGQIIDYNFYSFARGNVVLTLRESDTSYFLETKDVDGCLTEVTETKTIVYIEPLFI